MSILPTLSRWLVVYI